MNRKAENGSPSEEIRLLLWELFSVGNYLNDIQKSLAKEMGVAGAQWLILSAIEFLDTGEGARVTEVAAKLHVNSTSVTTQAKQLEKMQLVERKTSQQDGRVVLLSLTQTAKDRMAQIAPHRQEINDIAFAGMSEKTCKAFFDQSSRLRQQLEAAAATAKLKKTRPSR